MTGELRVAPWRLPRQYAKTFLRCLDWKSSIGGIITIWRLDDDWFSLFRPGDPIELVDKETFEVWHTGEIGFTKKIRVDGVLAEDMFRIFPRRYAEQVRRLLGIENMVYSMAGMFGNAEINECTPIVVIGVILKTVDMEVTPYIEDIAPEIDGMIEKGRDIKQTGLLGK